MTTDQGTQNSEPSGSGARVLSSIAIRAVSAAVWVDQIAILTVYGPDDAAPSCASPRLSSTREHSVQEVA
jgi:hypothetical protein